MSATKYTYWVNRPRVVASGIAQNTHTQTRTQITALEILPAAPNPVDCPLLSHSALLVRHRDDDSIVASVTVASKIYSLSLRGRPISRISGLEDWQLVLQDQWRVESLRECSCVAQPR